MDDLYKNNATTTLHFGQVYCLIKHNVALIANKQMT